MYEVLPRGASPRCAPPAKRRSARKADPRRGGQGRPAPRHRRTKKSIAAAWRTRQTRAAKRRSRPGSATCVLYLTFYTLSSPFFWFYFPRFPRPSPSLYGFPLPFCGFFRLVFPSPLCRAAARAHKRGGRQSGCGKAGAAERARLPPQGAAERTERLLQGLPRQKSGGSPYGLPPCLISVVQRGRAMRPAAGAAASDLSRPAAARGADSVPKQTRKKPRRRGTGRTVGNARRGNNAAARRSDAVSPPLLPQSAGAQTRRAGAYT